MKKLTSLEDTATITITGREAVRLAVIVGRSNGSDGGGLYDGIMELLPSNFTSPDMATINCSSVRKEAEALAFPQLSKKDLMLKELQSKMDALQCEIDKIKGETF